MSRAHFAFDWIDRIEATTSPEMMLAKLAEAAGEFGYTACAIATIPDNNGNFEQYQYVRRWPPGWFEHYISRGYLAHDPVIQKVRSSTSAFAWDEAKPLPGDEDVAKRLMNEAADFGLAKGFCVPSSMISGEQVSITFGGRDVELSDHDRRSLWMIGLFAHMHIRKLIGPRPKRPKLSPRELDVLRLCADGYRTPMIAEKLGLSKETVETYITNACRKLDVTTRAQGAVLASRLRLI